MNMYQSPIEVFATELQTSFAEAVEADIVNVVQRYGINVNKEELIKALDYDRQQYEEGYRDGKNADRWISADKEKPQEPGEVIVLIQGASRPTMLNYSRVHDVFYDDDNNHYNVTHWMPMPEVPEVKRDEL